MSTLVLKVDHPKHGKKGSRVTVPFVEAQTLVTQGHAERWNGGKPIAVEAPPTVSQEAHEKAGRRILELEKDLSEAEADLEKLKTELATANDIAEKLTKENKSLTEQVTALKAAAAAKPK